jgi:hypothetical protein
MGKRTFSGTCEVRTKDLMRIAVHAMVDEDGEQYAPQVPAHLQAVARAEAVEAAAGAGPSA